MRKVGKVYVNHLPTYWKTMQAKRVRWKREVRLPLISCTHKMKEFETRNSRKNAKRFLEPILKISYSLKKIIFFHFLFFFFRFCLPSFCLFVFSFIVFIYFLSLFSSLFWFIFPYVLLKYFLKLFFCPSQKKSTLLMIFNFHSFLFIFSLFFILVFLFAFNHVYIHI